MPILPVSLLPGSVYQQTPQKEVTSSFGACCSVRGRQACGWMGRDSDSARVPPNWDRVFGVQIPVLSEIKAI